MPNADDIRWLKQTFETQIKTAIAGTPFSVDLIVAIACQETGHIWSKLRKTMTPSQVLALCVGDTLDEDRGRSAFPKTKAALIAHARGPEMFAIARQALVDMAAHIPGFPVSNANKFCHGFGMFQYDLQFFKSDPGYFLNRDYERFPETLRKCLEELTNAIERAGMEGKASLTDMESAAVAIAYNTGRFKPAKGLKQGHFNGERFYGEEIFDFLRLAHTVAVTGQPEIAPPAPGTAIVPPPTPVAATGPAFKVDPTVGVLRVRSAPKVSDPPEANVIAHLPQGHLVRAVTGEPSGKFMEIETSLSGANIRGFCGVKFLLPAAPAPIPVAQPAPAPPQSGIVAVHMPVRPGVVTKRKANANASSLNENNMPGRQGTTPAELTAELAAIIDYLDTEEPTHARYQPRDGLTFCNIYAHDFCHLAGVYLPRVWWTGSAIEKLAQGQNVPPLLGQTIEEVRANGLFRWLRDFGERFGWRQTGTLTKLQQAANQGAVCAIVARRTEEGRPGHITLVVPETDEHKAARNAAGEVTSPIQSQAGAKNFRYGRGRPTWWNEAQFAEASFWIHA
jgi:hypothetical protein